MNMIRESIRNLAAFFVLYAVLLRLLPGESFARYLRFALGLLLVASFLGPIASALTEGDLLGEVLRLSEGTLTGVTSGWSGAALTSSGSGTASSGGEADASSASENAASISELQESIAAAFAGEWDAALFLYQDEIRELLSEQISDLGVYVAGVSVDSRKNLLTVVLAKSGADQGETAQSGAASGSVSQGGTAQSEAASGSVSQGGTAQSEAASDSVSQGGTVQPEGEQAEGNNSSVGTIKIEIPVISVFADAEQAGSAAGAEEKSSDGDTDESAYTAGNDPPDDSLYEGAGEEREAALTEEEITALVKSRIVRHCGISGESVEVLLEND